MSRPLRAVFLAFVMAVAGCAMQPVDARWLSPNVPQPQDTRRVEQPLFLVLDPAKLPDTMMATGPGVKPVEVTGLHAFVERDLQKALSQVFANLTVAPPSTPAPQGIFFKGDVLINSLTTAPRPAAPGSKDTAVYMRMDWSLHIRAYGAEADAFVYQGRSEGKVPILSVRETPEAFTSTI